MAKQIKLAPKARMLQGAVNGLSRVRVVAVCVLCSWSLLGIAGAQSTTDGADAGNSADVADVAVEEILPPMGSLLDRALEGRAPLKLGKTRAKPQALPLVPTARELVDALSIVTPAIRGCVHRHVGEQAVALELNLVLSGADGALSAAVLVPPFAGTAAGKCVESVVRRAKYPRFTQSRLTVRVPMLLEPAVRSPKTP